MVGARTQRAMSTAGFKPVYFELWNFPCMVGEKRSGATRRRVLRLGGTTDTAGGAVGTTGAAGGDAADAAAGVSPPSGHECCGSVFGT